MIVTKYHVQSAIKKHQEKITNLGVKKIGLFGSVIRGDMGDNSDIDLLVEFIKGKKNFDNFMDLSFLLEEIFKNKIDLVTLESLSENLRSQILSEVEYIEVQ